MRVDVMLIVLSVLGTALACSPTFCASTVSPTQQGNAQCVLACMTSQCNWDGGDCLSECKVASCLRTTADNYCDPGTCLLRMRQGSVWVGLGRLRLLRKRM